MDVSHGQTLVSGQNSLALNARNWKLFDFEHGTFLLNVPTAHIFAIESETAAKLREGLDYESFLRELEKDLPPPVKKELEEIDITSIALNVEQSCNLRCTYCYAGDGDYGKNSTMTFDKATAVIQSLAESKEFFHIHFFGGEPLLNFALIKDIILWCRQRPATRFRFSLTTNGVLLRSAILDFLREHRVSVTVSYDGKGIQEVQRKTKDHQSSDHVRVKIVRYLGELKALPSFKIRATVSKEQIENFSGAVADTVDQFQSTVAFSPAFVDKFGNSYSTDDVHRLAAALTDFVNDRLVREDFESILKLSALRSFVATLHKGRVNLNACSAGINYISVSTNGTYYLCHRFTEDESAVVGNYVTGLDQARLEGIRQHRLGKQEPCNSCWMRNWCGGGCFHDNKVATGDERKIDNRFCTLQDTEISLAMRVYTAILAKRPSLLEKL